jgi:hypothetical protein
LERYHPYLVSTTSKKFKKSTNLLHAQHLAQKRKKSLWLPWSFRDQHCLPLFGKSFVLLKRD